MTPLSDQQKQLLFDYCIGIVTEKEAAEAELLISSNEEAADIYSKLKVAFSPLNTLESEVCPDELAERTILRVNNAARSSQVRLEQLLAAEQRGEVAVKSRFWRNFGEVAAIAAVILFMASVLIPLLNFARQKSRQYYCQMQLQRMGQGLDHYSSDHDGKLPAVATAAGAPWWKVGYPGNENQSNTRHLWLLVKGNYVKPSDFVCPGQRQGRVVRLNVTQLENDNDFPSRNHITYSFRIMCNNPRKEDVVGRKILMTDLNPLFEKLPDDYSESLKLRLNKDLLTFNSINHNRRGQNVLFDDGGVDFVKVRHIGIGGDDIFTLQGTDIYEGNEVPSCETDAFVAP
jgi:hypothetical protein